MTPPSMLSTSSCPTVPGRLNCGSERIRRRQSGDLNIGKLRSVAEKPEQAVRAELNPNRGHCTYTIAIDAMADRCCNITVALGRCCFLLGVLGTLEIICAAAVWRTRRLPIDSVAGQVELRFTI